MLFSIVAAPITTFKVRLCVWGSHVLILPLARSGQPWGQLQSCGFALGAHPPSPSWALWFLPVLLSISSLEGPSATEGPFGLEEGDCGVLMTL